ncbi:30S ribosomal protein S17e [Candidatus Bathyarchaeota archaeon]|nr:30S ribosomal protein S17e [Candidatus Bathyarchaeota archaeon]RLI36255.1 MAG: 30S ribosomal protein S17e [Candidatus Bathyarchaeota archaeon]
MGKSRRVKTKRLAEEILKKYPKRFTTDFQENKKLVEEVVISTKTLRNKLAGYITGYCNLHENDEVEYEVET